MENIFITVVNMSIAASVAAVIILIIRWILGNKLHKSFSYALWAIVFIRLVLPFSIPSMMSIFNRVYVPSTISTENKTYISSLNATSSNVNTTIINGKEAVANDTVTNYDFISSFNKDYYDSKDSVDSLIAFMSYLWIIGVIIILALSVFAYLNISNKLRDSVIYKNDSLISKYKQQLKLNKNIKLYTSDKINSPLVCGLLKPCVILPLELTDQCSEAELYHFICHELVHIKRFDYIIKPLSFLALSVHWFNPLIWLCYILAQKDMELSCDSRVLSLSKKDIRKDYANSLINIATRQNVFLQAGLLAFGEKNIKIRVKGVMKFKRTKPWMSIISILILAILSVILLTNGKTAKSFSLSKLNPKSPSINTNEKLIDSLLENRFKYVGNASNNASLLRKLPYGSYMTGISLSTDRQPYGITANYSVEKSPVVKESILTQNALLVFSLIENVDWVTFNFDNPFTYTREDLQKYFEEDLWSFSKDKETFDKFFMDISTKIVVYPETFSLAMSSVMGMELDLNLDSYYNKSDFNISFSAKKGSLRVLTSNDLSEENGTVTNPEGKIIWFPSVDIDSSDGDIVTIAISDKSGRLHVEKQLNISKITDIEYKAEASYDVIFERASSRDF